MARLLVLSLVLILLCAGRTGGDLVVALQGDPAKFPASENCKAEKAEMIHWRDDGSTKKVAYYQDGIWKPATGYEDRITPGESVVFNSTNTNDKGRAYEFSCAEERRTELEVLIFDNLNITESHSGKLRCHYVTTGTNVKSVRWERGRELVFEQNLITGQIEYGTGFEGRVSLLHDGPQRGDLSLNFTEVKMEDRGDYFCHVQGGRKEKRGTPPATRLTVNKAPQQITTSGPGPACEDTEERGMGTWATVGIIAAVIVICAAVFTPLGWWLRTCCPRVSSRSGDRQHSNGVGDVLLSSPPHAQVNGSPQPNGPNAESMV